MTGNEKAAGRSAPPQARGHIPRWVIVVSHPPLFSFASHERGHDNRSRYTLPCVWEYRRSQTDGWEHRVCNLPAYRAGSIHCRKAFAEGRVMMDLHGPCVCVRSARRNCRGDERAHTKIARRGRVCENTHDESGLISLLRVSSSSSECIHLVILHTVRRVYYNRMKTFGTGSGDGYE